MTRMFRRKDQSSWKFAVLIREIRVIRGDPKFIHFNSLTNYQKGTKNPMTKYWTVLVTASLATLLALLAPALVARADVFQWEYINPANPSQGKQPSTTLAPDGAGVNAAPGANLSNRNLTMAYLIGVDLTGANLREDNLTDGDLSQANLTNANFFLATLTNANFRQANLTNAIFWYATLTGANLAGAEVRGASFPRTYLDYPYDNYLGGITLAQLYSTASYQAHDLTAIDLRGNGNFAGANLAGQNLTRANFGEHFGATVNLSGADLSEANLSNAYFLIATLTNANFSQANLTNASLDHATLSGANFTGAEVRGASFSSITNAQLYSTASYQAHDLTGIRLAGSNLAGINLSGQNLTDANLVGATLTNANLSQANLTNASFTADNYWSVADLTGANLSGANLTNAFFGGSYACGESSCGSFPGANLTGANLSGADARGATFYLATLSGANTSNLIQSDAHIAGLDLTSGASLVVRDYESYTGIDVPILVEQHLAMDASSTLRLVFDADPWDSTISFAPGIPVALGGTLELTFAPGVDIAAQSGRTIDLFDWTGVTPTGAFTVSSPYIWNLSKLYTTGEVTLTSFGGTMPGDFNGDSVVNAADFAQWKTGFGTSGDATLSQGDADGDQVVDGADFLVWQRQLGVAATLAATAAVPEPETLLLLVSAALAMFFHRRVAVT